MARPERNIVDYFPFYCEDGKKMYYLEEKYGNDGFAVFLKILRELAKTDFHYLDLSKKTTLMFLSAKCKVEEDLLISIISDLVDLEKFDKVLWSENNIIWCQDFIDSIQDAYKKRNNKCITYEGLGILLIGLGIRKQSKSISTVPVKPQRKEKETKPKKTKVNIVPDFLEFKEYALENKPNVCIETLNLKYKSWIENEWQTGGEKSRPIKNWKMTLLNTLPYIKENDKNKNNEPTINRQTADTIRKNSQGWGD